MITGSSFAESTIGLTAPSYAKAVWDAVQAGAWVRWPMTAIDVAGPGGAVAKVVVSDDYFAIGTDDDFVRVPLDPLLGQQIADLLGFQFPTARLSDLIWLAAPNKYDPLTGGEMTPPIAIGTSEQDSPDAFWRHSRALDAMIEGAPGLRAGLKKDIILDNRLAEAPKPPSMGSKGEAPKPPSMGSKGVAIYGWHRKNPAAGGCSKNPTLAGVCPIQGISLVHENTYRDYSHGLRMVSPMAALDGQTVGLMDLLASPDWGPVLNWGGPLTVKRQPGTGGAPIAGGGSSGGCKGFGAMCGATTVAGAGASSIIGIGMTLGVIGLLGWGAWEAADRWL